MAKDKHILIVEDEILIAKQIKAQLLQHGYSCSGIAIDYNGALETLNSQKVDFVLLDIKINGPKDGIAIGQYLNKNMPLPFIFLTSYNDVEILERLKQLQPVGYINKPINQSTLLTSIDLYFQSKEAEDNAFVSLKIGAKVYNINITDLMYVETDHIYIKLHFKNQNSKTLRISLSKFILKLPEDKLVQINRSIAINPAYVEEYGKSKLKLSGKTFKISSVYNHKTNQFFKKY
jgi:DNA-binding LytR/AlgR family response regulator